MAATILSFTEYKPNVPNSYFIVFYGSRTKESTKLSHLTSCIRLREQKKEPETPALTRNWSTGISSNDPHTFGGAMEEEGSWVLQFDLMENTYPISKSGNQHDLSPWTRNAGQHSGKDDWTWEHPMFPPGNIMLSHLGVSLYLWGIFFMLHMCLCGGFFVCAHNSLPKRNSFLAPWSPAYLVIWNSFICPK